MFGGGGPGAVGMGLPPEKPRNFKATLRRLGRRLHPERWIITVVLILGITSVFFAVIGPKLLGNATNIIFEGIVGKQLPADMTQAQAEAYLRANGQSQQADLLSGMTVTPGAGVDFTALGQVIALVAVVYLLSSSFSGADNDLATSSRWPTASKRPTASPSEHARRTLLYQKCAVFTRAWL